LIQEPSRRSDNEYILFKIAAAVCHTAGFRTVHLPPKLLHRSGQQGVIFRENSRNIAIDTRYFPRKFFTNDESGYFL